MKAESRTALVVGKNGQVAWELQRTFPAGWNVVALGRSEINLLDAAQVADAIGVMEPDLVINAAAYTAVDKAESDQRAAFDLNQHAAANIADALARCPRTSLIHISTDFVFDGTGSKPYTALDDANPLSIYGASKLAGEREVLGRHLPNSLILRTSWVYSCHGQNFVKTMLRLMADPNRENLNVVCDQVGTPTWAFSLAQAIWQAALKLVESEVETGTRVFNWTDEGVASWYDFAVAIQDLATERNLLKRKIAINPIPHTQYPTPARRPSYSVLDKSEFEQTFGCHSKHWRYRLAAMLDELQV